MLGFPDSDDALTFQYRRRANPTTMPLGGIECTAVVPLGSAEWYKIMPYLRVYGLPYHSVAPSAQLLYHSATSRGTTAG